MPVLDPNRLILTGENPFIRLSATDDGPVTTNASYWRILMSGAGAMNTSRPPGFSTE